MFVFVLFVKECVAVCLWPTRSGEVPLLCGVNESVCVKELVYCWCVVDRLVCGAKKQLLKRIHK